MTCPQLWLWICGRQRRVHTGRGSDAKVWGMIADKDAVRVHAGDQREESASSEIRAESAYIDAAASDAADQSEDSASASAGGSGSGSTGNLLGKNDLGTRETGPKQPQTGPVPLH
ncbi:unnamed protein product [Pleuronectes platessa]|uniref:Uncharacterized protein n=1 Tax=Pleuronectes platessa TaxID=8262 RepID=A0A9N7VHK0_PLEPL|nr:unnamed protein product [Pleuronectes platessa]